ncbi:MAG: hypothetical protein AABW59_03680 [archaeon]
MKKVYLGAVAVFVLSLLLLLACTQGGEKRYAPGNLEDLNFSDMNNSLDKSFASRFGVDSALTEYGVPTTLGELGGGMAGLNGICYPQTNFDETFLAYADEGMALQVNLLACGKLGPSRYNTEIPKDIENYKDWIKGIVGRYKGKIKYYQIDSEPNAGSYFENGKKVIRIADEGFMGTKEDFVSLLDAAYSAAKEADPEVKILCCGWAIGDLFNDGPTVEEVNEAVKKAPEIHKSAFEFAEYVMKNGKYDIASFHHNSEYEGTAQSIVNWARQYTDKPIWFDDMASGPNLFRVFNPEDTSALKQKYDIMSDTTNPKYAQVTLEMDALQAEFMTKKTVTSFAAGVDKVFIVWSVDAPSYPLVHFRHFGLIRASDGGKKPVFYTYKLLMEKIDLFTESSKIKEDLYKFSFVDKSPIFVAWSDGGEKSIDVEEYLGTKKAKITHIITLPEETNPLVEIIDSNSILVGSSPIIIEA